MLVCRKQHTDRGGEGRSSTSPACISAVWVPCSTSLLMSSKRELLCVLESASDLKFVLNFAWPIC